VSSATSVEYRKQDNLHSEASIVRAVLALLAHWRILLASVVLCWLAAIAVFFWMEKEYEAVALLTAPADANDSAGAGLAGRLGGVAALAGLDLPRMDTNMDVAIATLTSRAFLLRFIDEENLWADLYPESWDPEKSDWILPEPRRPSSSDAFKLLSEALQVTRDRQTGLVTVRLQWTDRHKAAEWLRALITKLNLAMRQQAEEEARRSLRFLDEELQKTMPLEVRQSIYRMMEMQINKVMLANVREDYVFRVIDPAVVPDEDKYVR
jgi:uncharacterized protein involved in exopolysaccharide biosynthesis